MPCIYHISNSKLYINTCPAVWNSQLNHNSHWITCSTVVLQCYRRRRRQAIPMEQAKIRPSVTLYSLDRSLSNLVWLRRRPLLVC